MITSFIQGGLGNQLFQIAAGVSLAREVGDKFFLIEGQHHLPQQGNNINIYRSSLLKNIDFTSSIPNNISAYHEPCYSYRQIPKKSNQILIGYFQSEKYFESIKNEILNLFSLETQEMPPGINVSMHIRQGDYLKNKDFHPIQPQEYYFKALEEVGSYDNLFVVSDSELPAWVHQIKNVRLIKNSSDIKDLSLMASCHHNIIANSSFSWWGAWMNQSNNKKVIAPKIWFGPKGPQDWQDIYCKNWRII